MMDDVVWRGSFSSLEIVEYKAAWILPYPRFICGIVPIKAVKGHSLLCPPLDVMREGGNARHALTPLFRFFY